MSDAGAPETPEERPEDVLAVRRQKLERLRERGIEPFARRYEPDARAADLQERFLDLEAGASSGERARVAGRLHGLRRLGKLWFGVLRDGSGEIQLMLDQATSRSSSSAQASAPSVA